MPLTLRHLPLAILAGAATYVTASGLEALWTARASQPPPWVVVLLVALALHLAWVLNAVDRRAAGLVAVAWAISLGFCSRGFAAIGFGDHPSWYALLLESILLLTALSVSPGTPWADRLARWRRARAAIDIQLAMSDGVVPWIRAAAQAFVAGQATAPMTRGFERIAAELADARVVLPDRVAALALPETLRQTLLAAAQAVVGDAQVAASRLSIEVERHALRAAAECRDACERLPDLTAADRDHLARRCETFLLDVSVRAAGAAMPSVTAASRGEAA